MEISSTPVSSLATVVTVTLLVLTNQNPALSNDVMRMSQAKDDVGRAISCTGRQNETFVFEWRPRVFKVGRTITFSYDVTAVDYVTGVGNFWLWMGDNKEPLAFDSQPNRCEDAYAFAHTYFPKDFSCPAHRGQRYKGTYVWRITPTTPIPGSKFRLKVELKNQHNEIEFCFEADLEAEDQ